MSSALEVNFVVYDSAGNILRTGRCPAHMLAKQAQPGEFVVEGMADDVKDKIVDGKIRKRSAQEIAEGTKPFVLDYRAKRRREYPSIEEQLEALWEGGAEEAAMRSKILAVKSKYPKPS